jgi:ATP-dependent Clp protease adapter protein ClpS
VIVIEYLVLGGAALTAVGWERLRRRRYERQYKAFLDTLSTEMQVVLHVANHEATTRRQQLAPMHLAYGLLQDDAFVEAVKASEGDADAIEARILSEMDRGVMDLMAGSEVPEAVMAVAHASATAQMAGRTATCADLFGHLLRTHGGPLFDEPPLNPHALLFLLVHGERSARSSIDGARDVLVVLRNDDLTTRTFVVDMLKEVFALSPEEAERVMTSTHEGGRGVVGRFASEVARDRVASARERAAAEHFPLWIGVEPV